MGDYVGDCCGAYWGDTRSLDNGSYYFANSHKQSPVNLQVVLILVIM